MADQIQNASQSPGPSKNNLNDNNINNNIGAQQNGESLENNNEHSNIFMFKEICGIDDETAEQLLQESGGDLEAAIHQFFFSRDHPEVLENQNNENHEELLRHRRPRQPSPLFDEFSDEMRALLNQNLSGAPRQLPVQRAPPRQLSWIEMFKALVLLPFRLFYWTFSECINFFYHFLVGPPTPPAIVNREHNNVQHRNFVNVVQDRILMNEQQNEYNRSLAIDRQKAEERKQLEQQRLLEERRVKEAAERARARTERLCRKREEIKANENLDEAILASDPKSEIIRIRITFPNGVNAERRFRQNDSLERLFNAVFIHPECPEHFSLVVNFPFSRLYCAPDWYLNEFEQKENGEVVGAKQNEILIKTFAECGLKYSANVMVQDDDA
uniref:UBX domain-containing protein n=1 Tax=Meloidogyne incognita TaxID=6306 RepID=A0A914MD55_MELIC